MSELLYDVKFFANEMTGPFMIMGQNPEQLRQLVESRLSLQERFGQPYGMDCLALNIHGVNEDAAAGRISQPTTVTEYVAAIVNEFRLNLNYVR